MTNSERTIHKKYINSADGHHVYYDVWDAGTLHRPVCLLVHGIGGDIDGWKFVRETLHENGFTTIALDVRGHGYSAHPRHHKHYAIDVMLQDMLAVIDAEGLEHVALVGHSGGAILSLQFALEYQSRLNSLTLLAGSYRAPAYMRSSLSKRIARGIISLGGLMSPPPMKPWHSTYPKGKRHREYEPLGLLRTIAKNSLASYLGVGNSLMSIDLERRLHEITIPTLLVVGENDSIYPVHMSKTMHQHIPHSHLKIVPKANHVLILNVPDETARHIIDFLAQ